MIQWKVLEQPQVEQYIHRLDPEEGREGAHVLNGGDSHQKPQHTLTDQCPPPGGPPSYVMGQAELFSHPEDTEDMDCIALDCSSLHAV